MAKTKVKQVNKQSVKINIKINNAGRRKKQRALQQQAQKLQSLNKQRERLFINNVVSIPEYNRINELNQKINKLENDIATKSLKTEAEAIKNEGERLNEAEAEVERRNDSREYSREKHQSFLHESRERLNRLREAKEQRLSERAGTGQETVKGIPATPNRFSDLFEAEAEPEPMLPMATAKVQHIQRLHKTHYETLKGKNLLPENTPQFNSLTSSQINNLKEIYNDNYDLLKKTKSKKGKNKI